MYKNFKINYKGMEEFNSEEMGWNLSKDVYKRQLLSEAAGLSYIPSKIPSHAENGKSIIPSMVIIERYPVSYTHLDVYKRQIKLLTQQRIRTPNSQILPEKTAYQ